MLYQAPSWALGRQSRREPPARCLASPSASGLWHASPSGVPEPSHPARHAPQPHSWVRRSRIGIGVPVTRAQEETRAGLREGAGRGRGSCPQLRPPTTSGGRHGLAMGPGGWDHWDLPSGWGIRVSREFLNVDCGFFKAKSKFDQAEQPLHRDTVFSAVRTETPCGGVAGGGRRRRPGGLALCTAVSALRPFLTCLLGL